MSEITDHDHIKEQISIRSQIECLELDLYALRGNLVKSLNDLIGHFDHSSKNAYILLKELDTKKLINFEDIDTTSELSYLIRDHDIYSSTMRDIDNLKKYLKVLEQYQELKKQLDY